MCDYSLQNVKSRSAKVGDKLVTRNFGTGTRGFAAPEDATTAVCVLPGTELAFSQEVACTSSGFLGFGARRMASRTAIFRQVNKDRVLPQTMVTGAARLVAATLRTQITAHSPAETPVVKAIDSRSISTGC